MLKVRTLSRWLACSGKTSMPCLALHATQVLLYQGCLCLYWVVVVALCYKNIISWSRHYYQSKGRITQRGARSLLYGGYSYIINRRGIDEVVYWRCTRSHNGHCSGALTTGSGDELLSIKDTHNHPPDQAEIEVKIVGTLTEKMQSDIRAVPQLYQETVHRVAAAPNMSDSAAILPTLGAVKSCLYRHRRKLIPPLPATRAEVHFEGEWAETISGKRFLLA